MHKYKFHSFTALVVILALSTVSLVGVSSFGTAKAQSGGGTACPSGSTIFIDNTATGTAVTLTPGMHHVSLAVTATLAQQIKKVLFTIDNPNGVLGRGIQVNNNPFWEMQWLSQMTPTGPHTVGATLELTTGSCQVPAANVMVQNGTITQNSIVLNAFPQSFEGLTNEPRNFVLHAGTAPSSTALDITQWTSFEISPITFGVVTPADGGPTFRFSAGPTAGTSKITVIAKYGGAAKQLDIPVKINAQTATSTSGTTSTGGNTTTSTTSTAPSSAPTALETDTPVKQCVVSKIGEARYNLITSGKERPTSVDFEAFALCFAIRNYVIPSSWVPVEAKKETIQKQPANNDIKVETAANVTEDNNGTKKQLLKFSGKAKPNSKVLIYIFSEPLVVTTSADKNGDWSYALEDPLEPGKHEAYALVNKGDGNYERSSVFSFAVAKVSAASSNPNGLSLNLESNQATAVKDTSSTRLYVGGVIFLVLIVAGLALNLVRLKAKKGKKADGGPAPETPVVAAPAPAPAPEQPKDTDTTG